MRAGSAEGTISAVLARGRRFVLDTLLPPQCLCCTTLVGEPGALCPVCWEKLAFVAAPLCACCGEPFDLDLGADALCGACVAAPPRFDRARAVFRYDDFSKALVLRFKHADRTDAAPAFSRWMMRAGGDVLAGADLLVPVPLHRWRLFHRRYNQAALLAHGIGGLTGIAVSPDLLQRRRVTAPQGSKGRAARALNVRGAFVVKRGAADLAGRRVVLVDDVLTSGATVSECARVLKAAGAAAVDVVTLARVSLADP